MQAHGVELALIRQNADLYYFTGTVQDGHLFIPVQGDPLFLVWRVYSRAKEESPLENVIRLRGFRELPAHLREQDMLSPASVGLEMDVLPAGLFLFYTKELWPKAQPKDISRLIRTTRAVKSAWEVDQIRAACRQVRQVLDLVPGIIRPGMSSLELSARIECELRERGHPGYIRMRSWNQELGMGQVLAGPEGAVPAWTNTPAGGPGTSLAYGMGAGPHRIRTGEPVSVDLGGCINGYCCDQTRLFVCGSKVPGPLRDTYERLLEVHHHVEERLLPGRPSREIYESAVEKARSLGLGDWFMGNGPDKVGFIGHGLGVEIDEFPFLAKRGDMTLQEGMVIAVEPKLLIPDTGLIGVEDTYLVTKMRSTRLTIGDRRIMTLS